MNDSIKECAKKFVGVGVYDTSMKGNASFHFACLAKFGAKAWFSTLNEVAQEYCKDPQDIYDDAKKYVGAYPYHGGSNVVKSDAHFYRSKAEEYGSKKWEAAVEEIMCSWEKYVKSYSSEDP